MNCEEYYRALHAKVGEVLEASCTPSNMEQQGLSHAFITELDVWHAALLTRPEASLLQRAAVEYQVGLLLIVTGHYRYAYAGLRATLELALTAVEHSAHFIYHRDWLRGTRDITWSALVDLDKGPLSVPFCDSFFPELREEITRIHTLARSVYRQCSEFVHGNPTSVLPLPSNLSYSAEAFSKWHDLADTVRYVIRFALAMRYLPEFSPSQLSSIERHVTESLSHLDPIRSFFSMART